MKDVLINSPFFDRTVTAITSPTTTDKNVHTRLALFSFILLYSTLEVLEILQQLNDNTLTKKSER